MNCFVFWCFIAAKAAPLLSLKQKSKSSSSTASQQDEKTCELSVVKLLLTMKGGGSEGKASFRGENSRKVTLVCVCVRLCLRACMCVCVRAVEYASVRGVMESLLAVES